MVNNSTNTNKMASHLLSLNIRRTMRYDIANAGPGLGQAQRCGGFKPVNWIQINMYWTNESSWHNAASVHVIYNCNSILCGGNHGRDRMVVGFTTTCAISAYHHKSCEFESHSWQGVLDTTLCDKVCQWLVTG